MGLAYSWFGRAPSKPFIRIPRAYEDHGFIVAGNTGSGKTTILRQMLYQVKRRGHGAVIHDPDRQFVQEFYDSARGDLILNPEDKRCPFWHPGYEVLSLAHALTMAEALLHAKQGENHFFVDHAQKLLAYLLYGKFQQAAHHRPSAADLVHWMSNPKIIDRLIAGTPLAETMTRQSMDQRSGIIGTFNHVYYSLSLLPQEEDRPFFSVRDWSLDRKPWLFFTSTPNSQKSLQPLHSLWLDMIILRLMDQGMQPDLIPVWIFLDELPSLQQLPQLERGLTRLRKTGNVPVLAFQNKSQLDDLYGTMSDSILDQAATTILLRQKGDKPTEWASKVIGQREVERLQDTRSMGMMSIGRDSQSNHRHKEEVVLPAEIADKEDLAGYLKFLNYVVPIKIDRIPSRRVTEGIIPQEQELPSSYGDSPVIEVDRDAEPDPVPVSGVDISIQDNSKRFA